MSCNWTPYCADSTSALNKVYMVVVQNVCCKTILWMLYRYNVVQNIIKTWFRMTLYHTIMCMNALLERFHTRENDDCNDDCNSSLEWSDLTHERKFVTWMMIALIFSSLECEFSRGGTNLYINTCVHKHKGHVSSASQKMFWIFLSTHAKCALWFEWNFTGIHLRTRIWICDSNLLTHAKKKCH